MPVDNHLHIYATQMVMWVIMLISPTPGGSGIAELIFNDFLGVFLLAGLAPVLAVFWRLLSYYIYLIIGSIILPGWLLRVFRKQKKETENI
jgi:glycosyltransferase 2 family protein